VAAEAEHVRPAAQADIAGFGTEVPAGGDEPFGMSALGAGGPARIAVTQPTPKTPDRTPDLRTLASLDVRRISSA
jgi:hypothetical protein